MTEPYYTDDTVTLHHSDCLDVLRDMPDTSVDAVVTDPPYGLSNTTPEQVAETVTAWVNGDREHVPTGKGFMGQSWDAFVPPVAVWDECLRVLKPGGHALVFAGSRTVDLMTLGLRLAGFEIRDSIAWLYGQGFAKSLDVSKAIDKAAGATREVVGVRKGAQSDSTGRYGAWGNDEDGDGRSTVTDTAPATPAAQQWAGWGSAMKPAFEPVVVARKPLAGSIAQNVLTYGTGALNVDGCRVTASDTFGGGSRGSSGFVDGYEKGSGFVTATQGRWPPNVVLDGDAAQLLDQQSGNRPGMTPGILRRGATTGTSIGGNGTYGTAEPQEVVTGYGDSGGASRFFPVFRYEAKAPTSERPRVPGESGDPVLRLRGDLTDEERVYVLTELERAGVAT